MGLGRVAKDCHYVCFPVYTAKLKTINYYHSIVTRGQMDQDK